MPRDLFEGMAEQGPRDLLETKTTATTTKAPNSFDPTEGMSGTSKFFAGAGKAVTDMGRGLSQILSDMSTGAAGLAVDTGYSPSIAGPQSVTAESAQKSLDAEKARGNSILADIEESRRLDAPLMATGMGMTGNIAGNVVASLPVSMIPGANTLVGASAIGSGLGLLQPTVDGESRLLNTAVGAGAGATGYGVGKAIGAGVSGAKNKIAKLAALKSQNAAKDATLAASREAGYVVPPSEVNPSVVSNLMERLAGKASVSQQASVKNQQVTNKLVRQALGLADDAPITSETIMPIKQAAWGVYDQVKNLGQLAADDEYVKALGAVKYKFNGLADEFPELGNSKINDLIDGLSNKGTFSSEGAVEAIKSLRYQAKTLLSPINTDPASKSLGKVQLAAAGALEDLIERSIAPTNVGKQFLENFRNARVMLGKVGTVERALVEETGDVSAKKLAAELAKGKPLTDQLKQAAQFARAFPKYAQQNVNPTPGGSPLDAIAAIGTSAITQNPGWLGIALARPAVRAAVLSKMLAGQKNYNPGMVTKGASKLGALEDPIVAKSLGMLAPSVYASQE